MIASRPELFAVLRQYNPWWSGGRVPDLPPWRRAAFVEIRTWMEKPPAGRALLLAGARQIGKTTLFLQAIDHLLEQGSPAGNILYATFDHPLLKLVGLEELLRLWREFVPAASGPEYLFLDEIQSAGEWQVWLKHQVDFAKRRRIALTGSATPLTREGQESGVGRWQTLRLATLSFAEYLGVRGVEVPRVASVSQLEELFSWKPAQFTRCSEEAMPLAGLFHEFLLRGGFPQSALMESIPLAQKLLREDIIDRVLRRDMTALFGVRRVQELEQLFLYLCLHEGGLLDIPDLCSNLQLKRPTVASFLDLLEATHLIYRLMPYGYGKEVLRGRPKIHLTDPAIAPSVLLKGKSLLEDPVLLGRAAETAFFKHALVHFQGQGAALSYWRGKRDQEIDIIVEMESRTIPIEVKYRLQHTGAGDLRELLQFCSDKKVARAYVITRDLRDFGFLEPAPKPTRIMKIPAPLACFWLAPATT
jgi:hypothetical protein